MPLPEFSRGAWHCVRLLFWYSRRYKRVHPSQRTLAKGLRVSDRQVRTYLAELKAAGWISVRQGGDGHPASYHLAPTAISVLTSGLLPGCFRAENPIEPRELASHQSVRDENFRAETRQSMSNCSPSSDQSGCTHQEVEDPVVTLIEPFPYVKAQTEAIATAVRACGFEPNPQLLGRLERKGQFYRVTGFRVAAAINRAYKRVEGTSNRPKTFAWFSTVVENDLSAAASPSGSYRTATPSAPRIPELKSGTDARVAIAGTRDMKGLKRAGDVIPPTFRDLINGAA
ncbi:MAG: helix-turn-helix domain-containing protein [Acidobacteriia bacterium]|nr:helix-turn-helix domain-containing protein [Terriglobia bacterium]